MSTRSTGLSASGECHLPGECVYEFDWVYVGMYPGTTSPAVSVLSDTASNICHAVRAATKAESLRKGLNRSVVLKTLADLGTSMPADNLDTRPCG